MTTAALESNPRPLHCIVKLGGAAITLKDEFETLNDDILGITAKQIRVAAGLSSSEMPSMDWSRKHETVEAVLPDESSHQPPLDMKAFAIVHGAGSFGHFQASRAKVNKGHQGHPSTGFVKAGFVATRISVTKLNLDVVRTFASEGIPAVGISPFCAGWSTCGKNFELADATDVEQVINAGYLPIFHGDAVLDRAQGCAILSGDVIVSQLATAFRPSYVVFLTNVAGVFDRPPSTPHATLLKEIAVKDGAWVVLDPPATTGSKVETSTADHDTTGGMATKIAEAASIAASGTTVLIVQAGSSHALQALLGTPLKDRGDWVGTIIRRAKRGEISS